MIRFTLHHPGADPTLESPAFYPASTMIALPNTDVGVSPNLLIHESIHLFQLLGTQFGRLLFQGLDARSMIVFYGAKILAQLHGKLYLDLRAWRDDVDDGRSDNPRRDHTSIVLNRLVGTADRIERVLGMLLGVPTTVIPVYGHLQGYAVSGTYFTSVRPPKEFLFPRINFRGNQYVIGGASLMECFSWYWTFFSEESLFPNRKIDLSQLLLRMSETWKQRDMFETYVFPLALAWEYLGEDGLRWFPLIADLALRPTTPGWDQLPEKDYASISFDSDNRVRIVTPHTYTQNWEDLHPGWRYVRILEFLKNEGWYLSKAPFIGNTFLDFYPAEMDLWLFLEGVSEFFGWQDPRKLAEQSLEQLNTSEAKLTFYEEKYKRLDQQYLDFPGSLAFPIHFLHLFEEDGIYPPPLLVIGDKFDGSESAAYLFGLHLGRLVMDILLKPLGVSWPTFIKPTEICPLISGPLSQICDHPNKSECAHQKFPGFLCLLRQSFHEQFNISLEDIHWIN